MIESTVSMSYIEDVDPEALDDELFHQELTDTVATLPVPTHVHLLRYANKMKMLDDIHIEVFGPPKPIEWDHDDSMNFKYVEPFHSYQVSSGSTD